MKGWRLSLYQWLDKIDEHYREFLETMRRDR